MHGRSREKRGRQQTRKLSSNKDQSTALRLILEINDSLHFPLQYCVITQIIISIRPGDPAD